MLQSRIVVFVLLSLAIVAAIWLWWPRAGLTPSPTSPTSATSQVDDASGAAERAADPQAAVADDANETARTAASPAEVSTGAAKGILRVTVTWPENVAATDVMIYLRRSQRRMPYAALAHGITDGDGVVELTDVPPGDATLTSDRGDKKKVTVVAGVQDITFELEGGVAVHGSVTDPAGAVVASAEIWLQTSRTDWSGGRVVTVTDAVGEFTLEHVHPERSLGATAPGFAPSKLVDLDIVDTSSPPARVELQLRPDGGRLEGTVTDNAAKPIAGAIVAVGKNPRFLDYQGERLIEHWTVRTAETGEDGKFAIDGIGTGEHPVAIRADGYGIWRTEVQITAGSTTVIAPTLLACAVLHGTATDGDGAPITDAAIRAYDCAPRTPFLSGGQIDFDETFSYVGALTDANGHYRLEGVTPGEVHVFAQRNQKRREGVSVAYTTTQLEVTPGSETVWDPVIADGRAVEGIVLYRDGFPMKGLFITLADERNQQEHVIVSGQDGVFRFLCLEDSTYQIRVQTWDAPKGSPPIQASGIIPDRGRTELRASWDMPVNEKSGVVVGRVQDTAGRIRNPKSATVTLHSDQRWFMSGRAIVDGAFRFDSVKPCRFRLTLKEGNTTLATSDWFELLPAATVDTGVLTTEPAGALSITVTRPEGSETLEPKLYLKRKGDAASTVIELGRASEFRTDNLTAGDYHVTGYFTGMVSVQEKVSIIAGQTAELPLTLQAGARIECEVWWPEGHGTSISRRYRILDQSGRLLHEYGSDLLTSPTRPYVLRSTLPPGRWKIEFSTDDGLRGEVEFDVANATDVVKPRIDLK